jgi:hypothetical protein
MNTPTRVAAFAVGLLAVFGGAVGIGRAVGPVATAGPAVTEHAGDDHGADQAPGAEHAAHLPKGLMVSQDGYSLRLADRSLPAQESAPLRFRILGPDGQPVTRYTPGHGKDLHLIAVRRDLSHYQHVHPRLAADGTWSVPLDLSAAGVYRVFADFIPAGRADGLTLGADLSVAGRFDPRPLPRSSQTAVVDGYTVTLDGGLAAEQESELTLSVSRKGRPVTDLQPYLEAYGHLVALRDRDLAYLHVHPAGAPGDGKTPAGPDVVFYATAPSDGAYRLFFDFQHDGKVRTAEFTVTAGSAPPEQDQPEQDHQPEQNGEPGHGHGG